MTSHHYSLRNFDRARRKAFIQSILNLTRRKSLDLLLFEQVRRQLRLRNSNYQGLQEVPLDEIIDHPDRRGNPRPTRGPARKSSKRPGRIIPTGGSGGSSARGHPGSHPL